MKTLPKVIAVVSAVAIGMATLSGCGGRDHDDHSMVVQASTDRGVTVQATGTIKVVPDGVLPQGRLADAHSAESLRS